MNQTIVGIDVSTNPKKLGLACLEIVGGGPSSLRVSNGRVSPAVAQVSHWAQGADRLLLAIDAPLGWPAAMGEALAAHTAGEPLDVEPRLMFQRTTDRFIHETLGKRPLDVGADRIARTAHAALTLLAELRIELGVSLPLAWSTTADGAIEVYPAATLLSHGMSTKDYKKSGEVGLAARSALAGSLAEVFGLELPEGCRNSDDELDAVVCTLAGWDFLRGECYESFDVDLARREGWIWVKRRA